MSALSISSLARIGDKWEDESEEALGEDFKAADLVCESFRRLRGPSDGMCVLAEGDPRRDYMKM